EEVERREIQRVVITGGEPLLQDETYPLSVSLIEKGFSVLLETNGSKPVKDIDRRVHKILDLKCPGSEMSNYMDFRNVSYLTLRDEIKFVISDREDFRWAVAVMKEYNLAGKSHILYSPACNRLSPKTLAEWIIQEKLNVRLQLQIHRYIWPDILRGV
ncbi:MAG: 7-carboxy-7-deazaguanine synthase QueE, partial [Proteobacteria bacterium]|nr:7-carboxy-7-deazaguanine synthase QueE [Pseudomonadota bacterium]